MTHKPSSLTRDVIPSGATRATSDAVSAATSTVHPYVGELQTLLNSPDKATIGELAALIQSISRDMSFFPAALRDVIETDMPLMNANGLSRADQPLGRKELEALGDLLSAQTDATNAR